MNTALVVIGVALLLTAAIRVIHASIKNSVPPWTILYDGAGKFSYVGIDGVKVADEFPTRAAAEADVAKWKKWHEDYRAGKFTDEQVAREARAAQFKPCP